MAYPKCPHCNHQFDAEDIYYSGPTEFPKSADGEETETKCLSCGHHLTIVLILHPEWIFVDEDHEKISK